MITAVALSLLAAALPFAQAQETTDCNPLHGSCPADPAMGSSLSTNFAGASSLPGGWDAISGAVSFGPSGAAFVVGKQGDSPTIQTSDYFFFGYVEVKLQAAPGQGIVSSIVMQSDDLDEVDWEFTGTNTGQTQTNYFGKGDTTTYDRAIWYPVSSPQTTFHTYAVNWTSSALTWLIDGVAVRTLNYADAQGGARFPQTPMKLKIGIWAGGDPTNGQGTIEWAGGPTNYGNAPFTMYVSSVNIVNYSPAGSYIWSDQSGSWTSIKVSGGNAGSNSGAKVGGSSSSSAPVVSQTPVISISVAPSVSSRTDGGVTATAMLTEIPLLTPAAGGAAGPTGGAPASNVTMGSPKATNTADVSSSNGAVGSFALEHTLGLGALAVGVLACLL